MNPACQLHGAGLNRIQDFLLRSLQPSTITKYTQALNRLSSDLAEQGLSWHEMSEEQKDYFLAEWLLDAFEDGKGEGGIWLGTLSCSEDLPSFASESGMAGV